jgi:hypothetical protein
MNELMEAMVDDEIDLDILEDEDLWAITTENVETVGIVIIDEDDGYTD